MSASARRTAARERGFSLIEMIVTLSIMAMVIAALSTVLIRATASRLTSANRFESLQTARSAADMTRLWETCSCWHKRMSSISISLSSTARRRYVCCADPGN